MLDVVAVLLLALSQQADAVSAVDRSGPSRSAKCKIDNEPVRRCRFTPLFGDGSFNIELGPRRQLRLMLFAGRALMFVGIAPDKQIRTDVSLHRDKRDRACWVADVPRDLSVAGPPNRICVYSLLPSRRALVRPRGPVFMGGERQVAYLTGQSGQRSLSIMVSGDATLGAGTQADCELRAVERGRSWHLAPFVSDTMEVTAEELYAVRFSVKQMGAQAFQIETDYGEKLCAVGLTFAGTYRRH